ncbi:TerB family tellurite resistance protein [Candidatus Pelagibacter sp.]|nr:TerB family tellurite resistance protein [Candidatus Pelagibacter sp.]
MISFFENKDRAKNNEHSSYTKIAALLIHAAKIDEEYTTEEREIIKKTLIELGVEKLNISKIISEATIIEENSNQILDFTREVKDMPEKDKIKIVESLWKIVYSNKTSDVYESNLMRRLAGLLYIDSKIMGDLKEKMEKG